MAKMHLHELLNEEQEPFLLNSYINEKRSHLKKSPPKTQIHLKRRKPISQNPTFHRNLCKNPCLFPSNDGKNSPLFDFPAPTKKPISQNPTFPRNLCKNHCFFPSNDGSFSPLVDFPSPAKTPCRKKPNNIAALIIASALQIPKQRNPKNLRFGFFASFLKRISLRKKTQKRKICREEIQVSVKDILRWDSFHGLQRVVTEERFEKSPKQSLSSAKKEISDMGFSFSCESSNWSEEFEEKSMDLESSCSSCSEEDFGEVMEFGGETKGDDPRPCERGLCSSPLRFTVPEMDPNAGVRTPEFSSPFCRRTEVVDSKVFQRGRDDGSTMNINKEDEDEKDQFSPVSVLDPPFEDDEDDVCNEEDDEVFEQSFMNVQRAKQNLLSKIRRFESLAELDPIELEKRMVEEEEEGDNSNSGNGENVKEVESLLPLMNEEIEQFVREVQSQSCSCVGKFSPDMRRLVLDLTIEETDEDRLDAEVLAKVCKRIESWKEVTLNTINMMVELDFKREGDLWRTNHEEVRETVAEIELAIFGSLVEELWIDLVQSINL